MIAATFLASFAVSQQPVAPDAARSHEGWSPFDGVVIVVNDSLGLYPEILARSGLELDERLTRHVNRRTGRRRGEFFEDVLVCRRG